MIRMGGFHTKNIKPMSLIVMTLMTIISFSNLLGKPIAGAAVIIGVVFFFINKAMERQSFEDSGLDIKAIVTNIKGGNIWFWVCLPLIMNAVSIIISKLFLPEYLGHVLERAQVFVSFENTILMVLQLSFLALGEEIAWRAFYQNQLSKALPIAPVLLLSSALFALGHLTRGKLIVVAYNILFVFVNSILYGIVFYKSKNAWISGMSHFMANIFSVIVLAYL